MKITEFESGTFERQYEYKSFFLFLLIGNRK
jgi:hypothetical protein